MLQGAHRVGSESSGSDTSIELCESLVACGVRSEALKTSDPIGVTSEYVLTVQRQMILGRSRRHTMECRVYAALDSMLRSVAAMDSDKAPLARGIWVHSRGLLRVPEEP